MTQPVNRPFYVKLSHNLLSITLICLIIYVGREILLPIFFGILLAILLMPVANWFTKKGLPKGLSLFLAVLMAFIVIVTVLYFLSSQVGDFMSDLPKIKQQLNTHWQTLQQWISTTFHFSKTQQQKVIAKATQDIKGSGTGAIGSTMLSVLSVLTYIVLLPIYTFLIMYYRKLIRKFLIECFQTKQRGNVEEVIEETKVLVNGYMTGLMIEVVIVAVLNTLAFLIIGIDYAIFLAVLVALLNMIPYVGMLVGTVICMLITLTTSKDLSDILWVFVGLNVVQFIDNTWVTPFIVSSKVKINALASIVGVLIGGALAGVAGMFLSILGVAIIKVVFERVDGLKPWGILLGEDNNK